MLSEICIGQFLSFPNLLLHSLLSFTDIAYIFFLLLIHSPDSEIWINRTAQKKKVYKLMQSATQKFMFLYAIK